MIICTKYLHTTTLFVARHSFSHVIQQHIKFAMAAKCGNVGSKTINQRNGHYLHIDAHRITSLKLSTRMCVCTLVNLIHYIRHSPKAQSAANSKEIWKVENNFIEIELISRHFKFQTSFHKFFCALQEVVRLLCLHYIKI